jgi:glycosyltransferase involved in cell wall biosynthesis
VTVDLLYLHVLPLDEGKANSFQVLNMCQALHASHANVTLAVPRGRRDAVQVITREIGAPPRFRVREYKRLAGLARPQKLGIYWGVRATLAENGRYAFCYTRDPFLARLAIRRGLKTVLELHWDRLHPFPILNGCYVRGLRRLAQSEGLVKVIVISEALRGAVTQWGVPAGKILVLHDGVDPLGFGPVRSRVEARTVLKLPVAGKVVAYVGSLYPDRRIDRILRLAARFPDATFLVVGGPEPQRRIYQEQACHLGLPNILFPGRVAHHQVRDYLAAADVLLMLWSWQVPTMRVCSPLKLFEGMAAERIIVAEAFPTIREVLEDGRTGLLADPESEADLERKLREALALDYPNEMATRARELTLTKYSWTRRAQAIGDVIRAAQP